MNTIWVIARRELSTFFNSLVGYIIMILFLSLAGLLTWLLGSDIFFRRQADLDVFFSYAPIILILIIPAITMRQVAEEKRSGTIELLLTKAVTNQQLVLGKFLACFLMIGITFLFTLPYYVTVSQLGPVDHGAILTGYIGLLLLSASYISIGIFSSSLTNNQIVAFLIGLFICLIFFFVFSFLGSSITGVVGELMSSLSMMNHYDSISRGVLDSKDLIYFGSVILLFLILAQLNIEKRN